MQQWASGWFSSQHSMRLEHVMVGWADSLQSLPLCHSQCDVIAVLRGIDFQFLLKRTTFCWHVLAPGAKCGIENGLLLVCGTTPTLWRDVYVSTTVGRGLCYLLLGHEWFSLLCTYKSHRQRCLERAWVNAQMIVFGWTDEQPGGADMIRERHHCERGTGDQVSLRQQNRPMGVALRVEQT